MKLPHCRNDLQHFTVSIILTVLGDVSKFVPYVASAKDLAECANGAILSKYCTTKNIAPSSARTYLSKILSNDMDELLIICGRILSSKTFLESLGYLEEFHKELAYKLPQELIKIFVRSKMSLTERRVFIVVKGAIVQRDTFEIRW